MPLNPNLYHALRQRFGTVKIANEGEPCRTLNQTDLNGKTKVVVVDPGEHYRVNCPYCGDTRHRLYVNHMYRTVDNFGNVKGKYLAHCFNEKCDINGLAEELKIYVQFQTHIRPPLDNKPIQNMFAPVTLPGRCVDLLKLPSTHPAIDYIVRERKFDPKELQNDWGVTYCESAEEDSDGFIPGTKIYARLVRNRIIAPITWQSKLVGWQARALDDHKIKYYTMPGLHKNFMLYNGDRARMHRFGVVVEGITDAWRVGTRAVALLGKSMSVHQRALASAYWSTGALCIMLDPDAIEEMDDLQQLISPQAFRWGAFAVRLPDNNDPADLDRDTLWQIIIGCAANRGIQLTSV